MNDDGPRDNVSSIRGGGSGSGGGNGRERTPPRDLIVPLELFECLTVDPPPRSWVVRNWIPRHAVTLMAGTGGVGKSLLAQQIATSVAANVDWLGAVDAPGGVLYLAAEEEPDELWRRQVDICRAMEIPLRTVAADLQLVGRMGLDNALCEWHGGKIGPSRLLVGVREWLEVIAHPQLLIVDNVAHMFNAGEAGENDRSKVGAFLNMLASIGRDYDVGVLLVGHPGKQIGSQYSGSTAWSDLARSRLFLGKSHGDGPLRLMRPKGNYAGADDDGVALEWKGGAFSKIDFRETPLQVLEKATRERHADDCVLRALDHFTALNTSTSDKPRAGNYLPKLITDRRRHEGMTRDELGDALLRLLESGAVTPGALLPWRDAGRNAVHGLARGVLPDGANRFATDGQEPTDENDTHKHSVPNGYTQSDQTVTEPTDKQEPHSPF